MATKKNSQYLSSRKHDKEPQPWSVVYTQPEEEDEGGLDLGQVVAAIRRRLLVIVGITTVVTAAAAIAALTNQPTYKAKFELLTEPVTVENKLVSSLPESLNSQEDLKVVAVGINKTELRILQSPQLMSPIVQQIQARYPDSGMLELKLNPIPETNILEVSYEDPNPEKLKFVLDLVAQAYLKYSLDARRSDIRQGIEFVEDQLPQLQQRVEILQTRLQIFRQQYDLIDPQIQGQQLSTRLDEIVQQRVLNHTQLTSVRALHDTLNKQLNLQPNQAKVALALSESPRYQGLLNKLQEVDTQIAAQSARYLDDSPTIVALRRQRQNLLVLVNKEAGNVLDQKVSSVTNNTQGLSSPNGLRDKQTQQFFEAAQQIQTLEAQDQALAQAESLLRQQVKQFPLLARQNDDLERKLKIAVDNLNQFLSKREALRIDAAQKQVPWQLLTPPTIPLPSVASLRNNLILGLGLGLFLGTGVALAIDKSTNVLYSTKEVKDRTKLVVLGEIPYMQAPTKPVERAGIAGVVQWLSLLFKFGKGYSFSSQTNTVSQFWESLRSLYTNIRFLSFDHPVHSIAVISASPDDGRSTIALHLAQTAAAMGQKVLLVDADLRNPKIHAMLGLENTRGLSNIIVDDIELNSALHNSNSISCYEAHHNGIIDAELIQIEELYSGNSFSILTAGQVPPNPTNLLSSHKMQELVQQFSSRFDLVIYDTSPLLGIADGNLLAAYTDASLLVVRLGKTNNSKLQTALEGSKISGMPILGVIANGVKNHSDTLAVG